MWMHVSPANTDMIVDMVLFCSFTCEIFFIPYSTVTIFSKEKHMSKNMEFRIKRPRTSQHKHTARCFSSNLFGWTSGRNLYISDIFNQIFPVCQVKQWKHPYLSSFSTQHAQRCVPARSVVTQWVCYPENHVNAFFWIKETHWRRWGLLGTQNRTAAANAFFPVHKSSSATSASEQLLFFYSEKCIRFISHKCGHCLQCICQSSRKAFQGMITPWIDV